jgi:SPP1 gp7 family putative phage head morphogenesis protein
MIKNQSKIDPTRMLDLRSTASTNMRNHIVTIRKNINKFFDSDFLVLTRNEMSAEDVEDSDRFKKWVERVIYGILLIRPFENILASYIENAYKRGVHRALVDYNRKIPINVEEVLTKFVNSLAFKHSLRMLQKTASEYLIKYANDLAAAVNTTYFNSTIAGLSKTQIQTAINAQITKFKARALSIIRTELTRAFAEAQLDALERLGMQYVGILAEYVTAGDDKVCAFCAPNEGMILTIKQARGMIPVHTNCRCAWVPYFE